MQAARIIPILVLGSARNGTTWLGNAIGSHPMVGSVEHPIHWGQHESNVYSLYKYAGHLGSDRKLIQFLELYASTDYFVLSEGDKDYLYEQRPRDFFDLYFMMMDHFAEKHGLKYWLTKLQPDLFGHKKALREFVDRLDSRYSEVRLVGIRREFPQVLKSYLRMEGSRSIHSLPFLQKRLAVVLECARYAFHYRAFGRFIRARNGLMLDFDYFKGRQREAAEDVCRHIGLPFAEVMLENRFKPNSSFYHASKTSDLSAVTRGVADKVIRPFFEMVPVLARGLLRLREMSRRRRVPFSWRLLRMQRMPERFVRDLEKTGQLALLELAKEHIRGAAEAGSA